MKSDKEIIFIENIELIKYYRGYVHEIYTRPLKKNGFLIITHYGEKWCSGNVVECKDNIYLKTNCYPKCNKEYQIYKRESKLKHILK